MTPKLHAGTLYVVFHGGFAFYQTSGSILAIVPDMGNEHAYMAGPWLQETNLERGSCHVLTGVKAGTEQFKNPLVRSCKLDFTGAAQGHDSMRMSSSPHSMLVFPKPNTVHELCEVTFLQGSIKTVKADVTVPFVPVFEYAITGDVALGRHSYLKTNWLNDRAKTLHIFSSPQVEPPPGAGHGQKTFKRAMLLLGSDLELENYKLGMYEVRSQPPLPPYFKLRPFELQPLYQRMKALGSLADDMQTPDMDDRCAKLLDPWCDLYDKSQVDLTKIFFPAYAVDEALLGVNWGCDAVVGAGAE